MTQVVLPPAIVQTASATWPGPEPRNVVEQVTTLEERIERLERRVEQVEGVVTEGDG